MEYTEQERQFVRFCVDNLRCDLADCECPGLAMCDELEEGSELCVGTVDTIEGGGLLSETEKQVLAFLCNEKLWSKRIDCAPKRRRVQCPNLSVCTDRESRGQDCICRALMARLGLPLEDDLEMLESTLESLILQNLDSIDWGIDGRLMLYDRQPLIPVGQPDILLQDSGNETLYVIELKAGWAMREHVGQLASYVSWYQQNTPAQFKSVRGVLVAKNVSEGARYALQLYPELQARCFDLRVSIRAA